MKKTNAERRETSKVDLPIGSRLRITGILAESSRGYMILDPVDGPIWTLTLPAELDLRPGQHVTVEGVKSGFDRIDVDWIGQVAS